jgi:hypothetical protein
LTKRAGLQFGRFFNKLNWSPWRQPTLRSRITNWKHSNTVV